MSRNGSGVARACAVNRSRAASGGVRATHVVGVSIPLALCVKEPVATGRPVVALAFVRDSSARRAPRARTGKEHTVRRELRRSRNHHATRRRLAHRWATRGAPPRPHPPRSPRGVYLGDELRRYAQKTRFCQFRNMIGPVADTAVQSDDGGAEREVPRSTPDRRRLIVLCSWGYSFILGGVIVFLPEEESVLDYLLALPFLVFGVWWCVADASVRGHRISTLMRVLLVLFFAIGFVAYLFQSRGIGAFRALGGAILVFAGIVVSMFAGLFGTGFGGELLGLWDDFSISVRVLPSTAA